MRASLLPLSYRCLTSLAIVQASLSTLSETQADCAASPSSLQPSILSSPVVISSTQTTVRSPSSTAKSSFMVIWDSRTRNPLCSVEKLHRSDFILTKNGSAMKAEEEERAKHHRPPFFAESAIPSAFRVNPKDYNDSKYDRGHLVPAADFNSDDNQYKATFSMANIAPQAPLLNRGVWERLESWIRHYLLSYHCEEILVISGPVYAPVFVQNQWLYLQRTIGSFPNLITVPSHFFKIVIGRPLAAERQDELLVAAFLFPNTNQVDKMDKVQNYLVKIEQLESIVGFHFLPNLLEQSDKTHLDQHVPAYRDLSVLLNVQSSLVSPSHTHAAKDVLALLSPPPVSSVSQDQGKQHTPKTADDSTAVAVKELIGKQGIRWRHLCTAKGVDCQKIMFPHK